MILLSGLMLFFSCKNKENKSGQENPAVKTDSLANISKTFILTPFILSQVQEVDSTPLGIKSVIEIAGKKDSTYINRDQFHSLAYQFIQPDLNDSLLSKKYREQNFYDESTNSVVQMISSDDKEAIITDVQIYLNKETGDVKSVYMEKHFMSGDTSITQKMRWKRNRHFQVISMKSVDGRETISNQKIIWDDRD